MSNARYLSIFEEIKKKGGSLDGGEPNDKVLLIDGLNTFIRVFSVIPTTNDDGIHVGGIVGFLRSIGYTINNICFACHFCNSKKSDKYSYGGFVNKNSIFHTCKCGQRLRLPKNKKISSFSCPICNTSYKKKSVIN